MMASHQHYNNTEQNDEDLLYIHREKEGKEESDYKAKNKWSKTLTTDESG